MAGALTPRDPVNTTNHPDDPSVTASGGLTPTRFNNGVKLTGGTDKQLLERSTAADGTTGLNLTSAPTVAAVVFPLTAYSGTPANGSVWVEEIAGVVTMYIKKSDGSTVSLVFQ
jgi:hypothetical protein